MFNNIKQFDIENLLLLSFLSYLIPMVKYKIITFSNDINVLKMKHENLIT